MAYSDEVLADNPLAYYRLSDTGATAVDSSGNGNDLTFTPLLINKNVASLVANEPNDGAASFNAGGSSSHAIKTTGISLTRTDGFTIEIWLRLDAFVSSGSSTNLAGIGTTNEPPVNGMGIVINGTGKLEGRWNNSTFGASNLVTLNLGQVYHIVYASSTTSRYMMVDGVIVYSQTFSAASNNTSTRIGLGRNLNNSGVTIDNAAFFDYRLSEDRALAHYNAGIASPSSPPSNTAVPTITTADDVLQVGSEMTSTDGTWTGTPAPTYAYQWQVSEDGDNDWTNISGATSSSITLTSAQGGKYVRLEVTATNTAGTATAYSAASAFIAEDPVSVIAPTVSGQAKIEQTLSADPGTWTGFPSPNFTYQWQRSDDGSTNWQTISGATSSTYLLAANDKGKYIRVTVQGSNNAGEAVAASEPSGPVAGKGSSTAAIIGALSVSGAI